MPLANQDKLLTANEVAAILGVTKRSVLRWIQSGRLHGWKVGFQFVLRACDVMKSKKSLTRHRKSKTASKKTH